MRSRPAHGGAVVALYVAFFLLLFLQYPLRGGLPGNTDSWIWVALGNGYLNELVSLLTGAEVGSFMYPAAHPYALGGQPIAIPLLYAPFRMLGLGDLWSYYFFITGVFALTGWAVYLLASTYVPNRGVAIVAGLLFTCTTFTLANIDDPDHIIYFLPALCLYFLRRHLDGRDPDDAVRAGICGGLQVYFGVYTFCFQSLAVLLILAANPGRLWQQPLRRFARGFGAYIGIAAPAFAWYAYTWLVLRVVDRDMVVQVKWLRDASLVPGSFAAVLPDNLLYDGVLPQLASTGFFFCDIRRHAFVGLLFVALAVAGIVWPRGRSGRLELLLFVAAGMAVALGPIVEVGDDLWMGPMAWVYDTLPASRFLRIPLRGFFVAQLGLTLLAARGLWALLSVRGPPRRWVTSAACACVVAVHCVENVPVPLRAYATSGLEEIPAAYEDYFRGRFGHVILDLPSSTGYSPKNVVDSHEDIWAYTREVVYMNWQTRHRQAIMGGVLGFMPDSRREVVALADRLPDPDALEALHAMGMDHLVVHKRLAGPELEPALRASPRLEVAVDDEALTIFRVR